MNISSKKTNYLEFFNNFCFDINFQKKRIHAFLLIISENSNKRSKKSKKKKNW